MPVAIPFAAAAAGYGATTLGVGGALFGAGLLGSFGAAVIADSVFGFVVSAAVNQLGSRALSKKPKQNSFGAEAAGRATLIRSSVDSHKVIYGQAKVSGPLVYASTTSTGLNALNEPITGTNSVLHLIIPLAGHEVAEIGDVYLNDTALTLDSRGWALNTPYYKSPRSYARVLKFLGSDDQAADAVMMSEIPGWTTDHRLRGTAFIYVRLDYNPDVFPLGIPNVSAVVKGKKVYDPRTALTVWSDNAALCIRDYMASDYGFNCDAGEINDTYFTAAANVCDESVTLADATTQARYTCNGVVDTATSPLDNLGQLITSVAGAVTYVQGAFRLHAGAYDTPTIDLPVSLLAGPVKGALRTSRKELFNAVKGTYVDPAKNWQPTDFPFITNATYEAQDNGERIYKDLELPFTTNPARAQRIAKIILEKARQGIIVEMSLMHDAMQLAVFDTVTVTNAQIGWSAKVFRVIKWSTTGTGPIAVVLQEESSASYDWNSGEATTIDAAPDTNLPNPLMVQPPGTPLVTEVLYTTTDGSGVKSKATVAWPASPDAFLREYQLEYKLSSAADYTVAARTAATTIDILDIAPGTYQFRLKAVNNLGVSSAYSSIAITSLFGLTAAPASVGNFSLNVNGNSAHLSWDQATDLDVKVGGSVRIRYTPDLTGQNWNASIDIGPALSGVSTSAVLPLLAGTYMAKFIDSSGNASAAATLITTDVVSLVNLNLVQTIAEHPSFAGDKASVVYDSDLGGIKLTGTALWSSYPGSVSTWPVVGSLGGITTAGTYDFANIVDLGAVYPSRLTASLRASGYDIGDLFSARTGLVSEWTSFTGSGATDFTNVGYWVRQEVTVTADAALAPDGTLSADNVIESTADSDHSLLVNASNTTIDSSIGNYTITIEIYVKPLGRNFRLEQTSVPSGRAYADFDLTSGVVNGSFASGAMALSDYGIAATSNGLFRCWLTVNCTNAGPQQFGYWVLDGSFADYYIGNGTSGVALWGYRIYYGGVQPQSANDDTNAAIYLRTTNDNPALNNWSEPRRFFVGDYTARAYWPQLRLTSENANHNILVTQAGMTVDMPEREETGNDIVSGAGTYSAAFAFPFRVAPAIGITAQNMATGDYYAISGKTESGFSIAFRNAAGTAVSRTFDWSAKGYGKKVAS